MANTKSAEKRARQTAGRTTRNRSVRTRLRRLQKEFSAKPETAKISAVLSEIDRAAKRGIIHKNAANRRKARLKKALAAGSAAA